MLTASTKFKEALSASHQPHVRVGVYQYDGTANGEFVGYLGVVSGSLTLDYRRNIRRQASLQLGSIVSTADAEYVTGIDTRDFLEALTAQSAEITIEWGIKFPDLTTEYVTLARLRVEESNRSLSSPVLDVSAAYDLGTRVADFNLVTPYAPFNTGGTKLTYVEAIQDLVNVSYPSATPPAWTIASGVDTTSKPPDNTAFTGDRWGAINALAQAINVTVGATATGEWLITPATTDRTQVWAVRTGDGGVLVSEQTAYGRREQYNAIPVRWEAPTGGGGLAYVVDSDPDSPTYYDGPFGRKPRQEETLSTVTSSSQAIAAATTLLDQYKGFTRAVSLTTVHNPLLEPGDVIGLYLPDGSAERHIVDSISLPLNGGTMSMETRILRGGPVYNSAFIYNSTAHLYDGSDA